MSTALTLNGRILFYLLSTAVLDLDRVRGPLPRRGRKRATFAERELNAHIRTQVRWPTLRNEYKAVDDVPCNTEQGIRSIDYVLIDPASSLTRLQLQALHATCELKGPARPTIWEPDARNCYDEPGKNEPTGIKPDAQKQHERYKLSPQTEHYVFWILERPERDENIDLALSRLLLRLRSDLPSVQRTECDRKDADGLWMFLFRVG